MSAQFTRDNCKIAVAKILQTIGWHSINSTPLEVLTDILARYLQQISVITTDYANEFGQTEANLDHLGLAFQELNINQSELEEYVKYVNFGPGSNSVPKYPIPKENNLNFLKPGSKEVVTRPVHIHEHLPPMYPLLEIAEEDPENAVIKQEIADDINADGSMQHFKKPADIVPEFRRPKREEEGSRPTREISSVMMTTSGFLSPAREGKLPEARTPVPPPVVEPPPPLAAIPPDPAKKKPEKRKEKMGKELFKATPPEEKVVKKAPTMKDVVKMKQMKAAAAAAAAAASNVLPPNVHLNNEVRISPIPHNKVLQQKQNFNRDLAAAKAKTEKFNTTITPIPMKARSPHPPIPPMQVDKLFTEPDKKKVNIFKKISNVKDKHDAKASRRANTPNLIIDEPSPVDIVNKITLSKDITIEPINPVPLTTKSPEKIECYFDDGSPPGTPSTPRTPEILPHSPPVQKEKRKRKEGAPRRKRVKKNPQFLDADIMEISMDRPKTPEAHLLPLMRQHVPPHHMPMPPMPFPLLGLGPGLIPSQLSTPMFPFSHLANLPNFGKNPYFPPMVPNMPPQVETIPLASPKAKIEPVERKPTPPPPAPQKPVLIEEPIPTKSATASPEIKDKKTKEHKKEKREKIKKKNKKDKVKEKSEKKKLKELKKDNKEKIKKEKKEKKKEKDVKETETPIPKILLKVNSPSPRPETPENARKLNIKPIIKKEEDHVPEKREPSPVGLAKISALVTGPPKPKNNLPAGGSPSIDKPVAEDATPPAALTRPPGRPRLHPLKPKAPPKPKKVEQTFKKTDEQGNEVWICPACGQQDDGRPMIGCDGCDAWYHWVCVGIQVPPDENENWYCKPCLCKKNEDLQTDKKKRRKKREKKEH